MIGYRIWWVQYHIGRRSFVLCSFVSSDYWNRDMKATCGEGKLEEHLRKGGIHYCGLYSYKSPSILLENHRGELTVAPVPVVAAGAVFNYGIVVEYSEGYRSSHALIDTIFLPEYDCLDCYRYFSVRRKGEFILARQKSFPFEEDPEWYLRFSCLNHLPEPLETPRWKTFPVEALKIELERYYQVPVRSLRELMGGR